MEPIFRAQHPIKPATNLLIASCPPVNKVLSTARTVLALDSVSPK
jgi:hypothetical protein